MATLTVQSISRDGVIPAPVAVAAGGDQFINSGNNVFIEVFNDHVSAARTVTVITQLTVDGLAVDDKPIVIASADERRLIGYFPSNYYNDGDGYVQLTYSDSGADMRIAVYTFAA